MQKQPPTFKFKVSLGKKSAPAESSQPSQQPSQQVPQQPASLQHHPAAPSIHHGEVDQPAPGAERRPSMPIKLKLKQPLAAAGTKRPSAEPSSQQQGGEGTAAAAAAAGAQPLKRIKLVTGPKPAQQQQQQQQGPAAAPAAGNGVAAGPVKPRIKLVTSSKPKGLPQATPSGLPPAIGTGGAASGPQLPVVRLTVAPSSGLGGPKKARGPPVAKKAKPGAGGPGRPLKKGRPSVSGLKASKKAAASFELVDDDDDDLDEEDFLEAPTIPRAPSTRHAAVAAAATISEGPQPSGTSFGEEVGMLDDDDLEDIAFTEAPQAMPPSSGGEGGAAAPAPALPVLSPLPEGGAPVKREDLERVVRLVQKRDAGNVFKEPVTEEVAPGYFKVIKEPMDFTTIRGKLEKGDYSTYEDLQKDLRLMFLNAMTYNPPDSPFYGLARNMLNVAEKLMDQARQGVLSQRQAAGEARKLNAALRAQERAQRDQLRAQARAEQKQAQEKKVLKRAGVSDHHEESLDESIRNSYRRQIRDETQTRWKALGAGASAEGAAFGWGRLILRPSNPTLAPGSYAASLARFAAGLKGKARELLMARASAAVPHSDPQKADQLLRQQLARQPPPPAPAPAPPPVPTAAAAAAPGQTLPTLALPPTAGLMGPMALQLQQAALMQHMQRAQQQQQAAAAAGMLPGMLPAGAMAAAVQLGGALRQPQAQAGVVAPRPAFQQQQAQQQVPSMVAVQQQAQQQAMGYVGQPVMGQPPGGMAWPTGAVPMQPQFQPLQPVQQQGQQPMQQQQQRPAAVMQPQFAVLPPNMQQQQQQQQPR